MEWNGRKTYFLSFTAKKRSPFNSKYCMCIVFGHNWKKEKEKDEKTLAVSSVSCYIGFLGSINVSGNSKSSSNSAVNIFAEIFLIN